MKERHLDIKTHIGENHHDGSFVVKILVNDEDPIYSIPFQSRSEAEEYADNVPSLIADKFMEHGAVDNFGGTK